MYILEEGGGEENMSQSYHEIFDTQAYILSHLTAAKKQDQDESGTRLPHYFIKWFIYIYF